MVSSDKGWTTQLLIALLILLSISLGNSQSREGNIVEYFGKEKVNEISEGSLFHVFKSGLAIQIPADRQGSISFPKDPLFDKFLTDSKYTPRAGEIFDMGKTGEPMVWKQIEVDTTNTFNDRSLRSSYVYFTFDAPQEKVVIFEASGHSVALINGYPHEGDHYDFGWSLIPIKLKKGRNTFVVKIGRFPRIRARLIEPSAPLVFTSRDMTTPDIRKEDKTEYLGGIRVVNTSEDWFKGGVISSTYKGDTENRKMINLPPLSVTKLPFKTPVISNPEKDKIVVAVSLKDAEGSVMSNMDVGLQVKSKHDHHKRTFLSDIDHSVQYYSVAPSTDKDSKQQAMFLSVHGASVEATNQARAYKKKDWGNLVAPTNRRPFGFAWEDWGRLDAMEVLKEAKRIYQPNPQTVYLTGHSMGGHGTWYLGATYPDHFGAIAPCAGYPDLLSYRNSFLKRLQTMDDAQLKRFGMTRKMVNEMTMAKSTSSMEEMIQRAGNPSRTLKFKRNYLQHGVYILHGELDNVVPTFIAREMRENLGTFHNDFTYYEYPEGTHWYGDHSVDWPPLFDFFKQRTIPLANELKKLEFATTSPGVSASAHFLTIHQQDQPLEVSSFNYKKGNELSIDFENTQLAEVKLSMLSEVPDTIMVNDQKIGLASKSDVFLVNNQGQWETTIAPSKSEKGPHRNGSFKDAFRNQPIFVYGTKGSEEENKWNYMKAMFDAETFGYRANGRIEVISDQAFRADEYEDRNVVIYGNADNNMAWKVLLSDCPIQVRDNEVSIAGNALSGGHWGTYFVYPRPDSEIGTVGVVSGTGMKGMKSTYANHYLVNGSSYPDFVLFDNSVLHASELALKCAGFFGNDWSVENGTWEWK
jgi:pimeloyl-ACP methyl ester carboxylesterase